MKIGDNARLIQPVIQGTIVDVQFNKETNELDMMLQYIDSTGSEQTRWFAQSELEAV